MFGIYIYKGIDSPMTYDNSIIGKLNDNVAVVCRVDVYISIYTEYNMLEQHAHARMSQFIQLIKQCLRVYRTLKTMSRSIQ